MVITVIGSSFRLTPPSTLQAAVADRDAILARLLGLRESGRIHGAILLATCNRLDVILDAADDAGRDLAPVVLGPHAALPHHEHVDAAATHYLLRVATGLESLVCGEEQILGQIRDAVKAAAHAGLLSPVLRVFASRLVAAARDTRRQAGITGSKVSVAALAARQMLSHGERFVVVGAGATGRLAVDTLVRHGCRDVLIVNRTLDRAQALATHFDVAAMGLAEFLREAAGASGDAPRWDGVLFAVDSDRTLFDARHAQGLKVVVDISMPGVLDASLADVPGLEVLDLDRFAALVHSESARRESAHHRAAALVEGRAKALHRLVVEADTGTGLHLARIPAVHMETALAELEKDLAGRLDHLTDADKAAVRQLLTRVVKRNAHLHLADVRELCTRQAVTPTRHAPRRLHAAV